MKLSSTADRTLQLQRPRLKEAGREKGLEAKSAGVARKRPELKRLLGEVSKGDVLVVTRLGRLARPSGHS